MAAGANAFADLDVLRAVLLVSDGFEAALAAAFVSVFAFVAIDFPVLRDFGVLTDFAFLMAGFCAVLTADLAGRFVEGVVAALAEGDRLEAPDWAGLFFVAAFLGAALVTVDLAERDFVVDLSDFAFAVLSFAAPDRVDAALPTAADFALLDFGFNSLVLLTASSK